MTFQDLLRIVGGTIIHDDNLIVRIVDLFERLKAGFQRWASIISADDDRDLGHAGEGCPMGDREFVVEESANRGKCLLGSAVALYQTEGPIENFVSATVPLVGPGIENCSGQSTAHHGIKMPSDHFGLLLLGVADGIHPELPHDQRFVLCKILETGKVALKILPAMQIDIEGQKIDILRQ